MTSTLNGDELAMGCETDGLYTDIYSTLECVTWSVHVEVK